MRVIDRLASATRTGGWMIENTIVLSGFIILLMLFSVLEVVIGRERAGRVFEWIATRVGLVDIDE